MGLVQKVIFLRVPKFHGHWWRLPSWNEYRCSLQKEESSFLWFQIPSISRTWPGQRPRNLYHAWSEQYLSTPWMIWKGKENSTYKCILDWLLVLRRRRSGKLTLAWAIYATCRPSFYLLGANVLRKFTMHQCSFSLGCHLFLFLS